MYNENLELLKEYVSLVEKNNPLLLEGLISTRPPNSVKRHLEKWHKNIMHISIIDIEDGAISITFSKYSNDERFQRLLVFMNTLGYFCASFSNRNNKRLKFKDEDDFLLRLNENSFPITMIFEAKYDAEIDINTILNLYHVTNSKYVDKIKEIGLVPKTKSKLATHPDRIYLATSIESAENMKDNFEEMYPNESFDILKIDISQLDQNIKFYNDTNFSNLGVYTYWNIPKKAISKI